MKIFIIYKMTDIIIPETHPYSRVVLEILKKNVEFTTYSNENGEGIRVNKKDQIMN